MSETKHIAALDIGSNSFHFVYARILDGSIQVLHREKYRARLADGLATNNTITEEAIERGLHFLQILQPIVAGLDPSCFRAVATYSLRKAHNAQQFLDIASKVFPHPIEIISGHEEARLIYQGVAHTKTSEGQRLVMDIGGGSTEFIVGEGFRTNEVASLEMGCVSYTQRFFKQKKISEKSFQQAIIAAEQKLQSIRYRFNHYDLQHLIGCSGSVKAICRAIDQEQGIHRRIHREEIYALKQQLLQFKHIDDIQLSGIAFNRQQLLCAGVAIIIAVFETFNLQSIEYSEAALREGVLYETFVNFSQHDPKKRTITSLMKRFSIDHQHVAQVKTITDELFNKVQSAWQLSEQDYELLDWAISLHEIGFDINTTSYHRHGYYILNHADLPGFYREQQQALAWLVGSHRKKLQLSTEIDQWRMVDKQKVFYLCALLRLAVLLNQRRQLVESPRFTVTPTTKGLILILVDSIQNTPLIKANLLKEQNVWQQLGLQMQYQLRPSSTT